MITFLSLAKFLSCEGKSGSARNSKKLRETFTAPATLPVCSTSGGSRTSTTSVLPCAIISRACAAVIRGTAALAASIISFKFVAMCLLLLRVFPVRGPSLCAGATPLANSVRDFEGMAHPLRSKPSFDQHQCRLDLNDLRAGKTSKGGKNETVTSSVVLVRTRFYPVRMAGLVRRASNGNGKASAGKY